MGRAGSLRGVLLREALACQRRPGHLAMAGDENPDDVVETVEAPQVQKVVYEQDLRAGARGNGWASDILGAKEVAAGGSDLPPDLPEEPSFHRHDKPEKRSPILMYGLAFTYLTFGALGIWVGITMLRDLRGGKEQP